MGDNGNLSEDVHIYYKECLEEKTDRFANASHCYRAVYLSS